METEFQKHDGCLATAIAIFGDKWTVLLIDALSCSPLRFCQLQDSAGGINPRTLSQRLSMLESEGIVAKQVFDERSLHTEYRLTPKGIDVLPIIRSMREWSAKYPTRQTKRRLASMT